MFNTYVAAVFAGLAGGLLAWAIGRDRKRKQTKRNRFAKRESLSLEEIYSRFYETTNLDKEYFLLYWREVANLLSLEAGRLRPSDRFDKELRPVEDQELGDELEDLHEFLYLESQEKCIDYVPERLKTIDDVVRLLAGQADTLRRSK